MVTWFEWGFFYIYLRWIRPFLLVFSLKHISKLSFSPKSWVVTAVKRARSHSEHQPPTLWILCKNRLVCRHQASLSRVTVTSSSRAAARSFVLKFSLNPKTWGAGGSLLIIIPHSRPLNSFSAQSKTFTGWSTQPFNPGDSCHSLGDSDTSATSQLLSQIRKVAEFTFPFPLWAFSLILHENPHALLRFHIFSLSRPELGLKVSDRQIWPFKSAVSNLFTCKLVWFSHLFFVNQSVNTFGGFAAMIYSRIQTDWLDEILEFKGQQNKAVQRSTPLPLCHSVWWPSGGVQACWVISSLPPGCIHGKITTKRDKLSW